MQLKFHDPHFEKDKEEWEKLILTGNIELAKKIYWEKLYPTVEKRFLKRMKNRKVSEYDVLIIPMGMAAQYYILQIKALNPKKVYFLSTPETEKEYLGKIIEMTNLQPSQYHKELFDYATINAPEAYDAIKKIVKTNKGKKIAVDITRGKRSMIAGASLVGEFFDCDIIYVYKGWLPNLRLGDPGTEDLVILDSSLYLFGDLENNYAIQLFNNYEYTSASALFAVLKNRSRDPRIFEIKNLISDAYAYWDSFNYKAAGRKIEESLKKINQYKLQIYPDPKLNLNLKVLKVLGDLQGTKKTFEVIKNVHLVSHLISDLYCNARRREKQGRFEDAVSRYYRIIELIAQNRLALRGISTGNPDFTKIAPYLKEFKKTAEQVYVQVKSFPSKIPLMDAQVLLYVMKDDLWEASTLSSLKKLYETILLRDTSLIAHGIRRIDRKTFLKFEDVTKKFIYTFFELNNFKFGNFLQEHRHISLDD